MRDTDIRCFYELLDELNQRLGDPRRLRDCTANSGWPVNGVYFFFEEGESRKAGQGLRVVRVGSHALKKKTPSRETLWDRLEDHRGRQDGEAGPRHSHSIFRKHVGGAIIRRDQLGGSEVLDNWYHCRPQPLADLIEDHVYWDADLIRRMSGQDVDLTRPLPPDLIMAAAQADPEIAKVVGPYQAMLALPGSLDAVQARARDIYASGWRPPIPPGPTRDELAGLVTAAASSHGCPAQNAALSVATAPARPRPDRQPRRAGPATVTGA